MIYVPLRNPRSVEERQLGILAINFQAQISREHSQLFLEGSLLLSKGSSHQHHIVNKLLRCLLVFPSVKVQPFELISLYHNLNHPI